MKPFDLDQIRAAAYGRWPEIHATLGIPHKLLNKRHQPCPSCGGEDRFRYTDYQGNGGYICNQCGAGSGFDLLMLVLGWDFQTALHETAAVLGFTASQNAERRIALPTPQTSLEARICDKTELLQRGWNEAAAITPESPVARYLAARGLDVEPLFAEMPLRYAFSEYWTSSRRRAVQIGWFDTMTAAITDREGRLKGLHKTYLQERIGETGTEWAKLDLLHPETGAPLPAKKMYAAHNGALRGAAVRFAPPDKQGRIIVAEGIETALAAAEMFGLPASAALSANGIAAFEWTSGTGELFIVVDNDPTGRAAAEKLARRALKAGLMAYIWQPETAGFDALDELNARKNGGSK